MGAAEMLRDWRSIWKFWSPGLAPSALWIVALAVLGSLNPPPYCTIRAAAQRPEDVGFLTIKQYI